MLLKASNAILHYKRFQTLCYNLPKKSKRTFLNSRLYFITNLKTDSTQADTRVKRLPISDDLFRHIVSKYYKTKIRQETVVKKTMCS